MKLAQVNGIDIPANFFAFQPRAARFANTPGSLISYLLPNVMVVAGIIFFFMILAGGLSLIMGAGKDKSPQEAAKGKAAITWGLIGFLLVISAFFILQIITTITGINFNNPPNL